MSARLRHWIETVRTGFWFVPIVMLFGSGVLALLLLHVDGWLDPGMKATLRWAYSGGPEGARSLLSTIAGSMITAASVTFSLASVALSIASQQYGSRVLRNFMRDTVTQVLLGTFLATFLYSVLVVRTIRGSDYGGGFVPAISVTVAIGLSVFSLAMLVYFIHHVSASIQASRIVQVIARDIQSSIPHLYPDADSDARPPRKWQTGDPVSVVLTSGGYLQSVDLDGLKKLARRRSAVIELLARPGDHLLRGRPVARVWDAATWEDEDSRTLLHALILGGQRTPEQDIRYTFQQLTDVIVRALSPGINDPFTAVNGIDELVATLDQLAQRPRVQPFQLDEDGVLRLVGPVTGPADLLQETVGHIILYGAGDHFVTAKLREVLDVVAPNAQGHDEVSTIAELHAEIDRREAQKRATG